MPGKGLLGRVRWQSAGERGVSGTPVGAEGAVSDRGAYEAVGKGEVAIRDCDEPLLRGRHERCGARAERLERALHSAKVVDPGESRDQESVPCFLKQGGEPGEESPLGRGARSQHIAERYRAGALIGRQAERDLDERDRIPSGDAQQLGDDLG